MRRSIPQLSMAEKMRIYDILWEDADAILKELNPCAIKGGVCCGTYSGDKGLCCKGCKHLTATGCGVRSLACKVWTCSALRNTEANQRLRAIERVTWVLGIPMMIRASKEENFASLREQQSKHEKGE